MIKLVFAIGREVFTIEIFGKKAFYRDRKNKVVRVLPPKDEKHFDSEEDKDDYQKAKTEEDIEKFIIKDCKKTGGRLLKREQW